ncbi:LysR family substrate-binding domain-containing protein [Amycolatopsis regifaucium]|uniref:LysR family transcriptional regulator n=1 Tax=Amycolatopsis regifaucium TaxID=546365 RepID=A0A154MP67_9PSEU|nr:LysR family substrate-binding domain-containing protein [Amycolatopsis regifaucium]KZB86066.1 LysR family transcriptional regulator [Amycolatopsis regifaucium]OKA04958.1 LysR family transcriptional regulator [Amycolatopsis regifaucium]SFH76631.1 LysR substrate binding domain-containing protein [Amycolatopsis regifaucium]
MTGPDVPLSFKLAYVPGVTPSKWVRIWNERSPGVPLDLVQTTTAEAAALVRDREVDAVLLRLPIDRTGLHAIPLYTETTVVVVPKDHLVAAADEVSVDDICDEVVLHPLDDTLDWERPPGKPALDRPATTADAIELVAAGVGLLVVPQSLARLHHRRDLTYRPISGTPESGVALSWPEDGTTDLMEQFIGIVRGRTVNSTRGRQQTPEKQSQEKQKQAPAKSKRPQTAGRKPQPGKRGAPKGGKRRRRG